MTHSPLKEHAILDGVSQASRNEAPLEAPKGPNLSALSTEKSQSRPEIGTHIRPSSNSTKRSPSDLRPSLDSGLRSYGSPSSSIVSTKIDATEDSHQLVSRSFGPRVAVFAAPDADTFARTKGFDEGVYGILRPFGEELQGKVVIRDSLGGSKSWNGFGVRFTRSQVLQQAAVASSVAARMSGSQYKASPRPDHDPSIAVETLLETCLRSGYERQANTTKSCDSQAELEGEALIASPLYYVYLRTLLSSTPIAPFETFSHPVACVIVVSSHNPAPIDTLRQLYASTGHEQQKVPLWVSTEYLRYYVLIHDEDNGDLTKSTALFDLMRRHFGLHCHLLRLKGTAATSSDDDGEAVPPVQWLSADEKLARGRMQDVLQDDQVTRPYIARSDASNIIIFLREMVVQSIIPFMENRVMTWNDQVASRRRGISGRFMSLSKRWTGFGAAKNGTSIPGGGNPTSNYDQQARYYLPESPEATMRRLADYAFMLRDWRLAYTTYDIVRADFAHDKAWQYHAAANEMSAITSLLNAQSTSTRYRADLVDQMLDTAIYSYLNRCETPWGAMRCLVTAVELLASRGSSCVDDTARWVGRLLELDVLRPVEQVLLAERVSDGYLSRSLSRADGTARGRQAALWNILSSTGWARIDRADFAANRLHKASDLLTVLAMPDLDFTQIDSKAFVKATDRPNTSPNNDTQDEQQEQLIFSFSTDNASSISARLTPRDIVDAEGFVQQDAGHSMRYKE